MTRITVGDTKIDVIRKEIKNIHLGVYPPNGRRYLLKVISSPSAPKVEIRGKTHMNLYVREGQTREKREKIMTEWYRRQLKKQIPSLLEKWRRVTGIQVKSWGVKQMKTKWGTCNAPAKRIWLNLELAKKPVHCLEYIIVHEMVHLLERHHNERFTAYMDKFMPRWRVYKDELNRFILGHAEWRY